MIDARIRHGVLVVVVIVWATNFFAGLVVTGYEPDPQVHAVFMIVVGAIFAVDLRPSLKKSQTDTQPRSDGGGSDGT